MKTKLEYRKKMKKCLLTVFVVFCVSTAFAANVIIYKDTTKGEAVFEILNSK